MAFAALVTAGLVVAQMTTTRGASAAPPTSGPAGYTFCASQHSYCTVPGYAVVAYGANGGFSRTNATGLGAILCDDAMFGGDPAPNLPKACYYKTSPSEYAWCSDEGGTCAVPWTVPGATVAYGADGSYLSRHITDPISCDSTTFGGDPAPGVVKACFFLPDPVPPGLPPPPAE